MPWVMLRGGDPRDGQQRGSARGQMEKISARNFILNLPLASHHSITSSARMEVEAMFFYGRRGLKCFHHCP